MEKKFKFKSVTEFEKFISKNEYLKLLPIRIVESIINYQGYAIVKEIEDPETLVTQLKIEPCKAVSDIFYKIEVIKEDLNKYAKEGIENPKNCTIEKLRQELLKIKDHFGENWRGEQLLFAVDKYAGLIKWIRLFLTMERRLFPENEINNLLLIVDKYNNNSIWLGKEFGNKLCMLLGKNQLINEDISRMISYVIDILVQEYGKINIDFSALNKTKYEMLEMGVDGEYKFTNLNCHSVKFNKGTITIKNSVIDKLDLTSKELRSITLENIITSKLPTLNIPKKDISLKNIKTYAQIDLENKEKIKKAIKNKNEGYYFVLDTSSVLVL